MPSYLRSHHDMNTRVLLTGAAALYRQWCRLNPRRLRNAALQGMDYVYEVLNKMAGDTIVTILDFFNTISILQVWKAEGSTRLGGGRSK